MAKGKTLNTVVARTKNFGTYSYQARGMPKVTTYAHSFPVTVNSLGLCYIQSKGRAVYDQETMTAYVKELIEKDLGISLPGESIGNRGGDWKLAHQRIDRTLTVNGQEFNPPLKQKYQEEYNAKIEAQKAKLLEKANHIVAVAPIAVATPQATIPQAVVGTPQVVAEVPKMEELVVTPVVESTPVMEAPIAVADTTDKEVTKILDVIASGKFSHTQLQSALKTKYGDTRGVELWNKAVETLNSKQVIKPVVATPTVPVAPTTIQAPVFTPQLPEFKV